VSQLDDIESVRPLAGLSDLAVTVPARLRIEESELAELADGLSAGFADGLAAAVLRYDEAVAELSLYR